MRLRLRRARLAHHRPASKSAFTAPDNRLLYVSADTVPQADNRQPAGRAGRGRARRCASGPGRSKPWALPTDRAGAALPAVCGRLRRLGRAQLASLRLILLAGNVGALVLIILAGWYFADESLKPIARVVRQVKKITASELSRRVDEGNGTDEIAQLASTFNQMLGGLEQAFEAQKSFVSHASHELRTPLTVALGTLQTALGLRPDPARSPGKHGLGRGRLAPPGGPHQWPADPGPGRRGQLAAREPCASTSA